MISRRLFMLLQLLGNGTTSMFFLAKRATYVGVFSCLPVSQLWASLISSQLDIAPIFHFRQEVSASHLKQLWPHIAWNIWYLHTPRQDPFLLSFVPGPFSFLVFTFLPLLFSFLSFLPSFLSVFRLPFSLSPFCVFLVSSSSCLLPPDLFSSFFLPCSLPPFFCCVLPFSFPPSLLSSWLRHFSFSPVSSLLFSFFISLSFCF